MRVFRMDYSCYKIHGLFCWTALVYRSRVYDKQNNSVPEGQVFTGTGLLCL
jgi:hypothetical protein